MSTDEITTPLYYVVSRTLTSAQEYAVRQALSLTPIVCAIVSSPLDAEHAHTFSEEVFSVSSAADTHLLAKQLADRTGQPALIVGDADVFESHYSDGTKEKIV